MLSKKKICKTFGYKPRAKFFIVNGHLSERTSKKTLGKRDSVKMQTSIIECINTTTQLQKQQYFQLWYPEIHFTLTTEYLFHHCYLFHHHKSMLLFIYYGFFKMSAKHATMGSFTPRYPKLDKEVMEWFSQEKGKCFICNVK